jgi:hypothetical protein
MSELQTGNHYFGSDTGMGSTGEERSSSLASTRRYHPDLARRLEPGTTMEALLGTFEEDYGLQDLEERFGEMTEFLEAGGRWARDPERSGRG